MSGYNVYVHKTPDNKYYVGLTSLEPKLRFLNGKGYKGNSSFCKAIQQYGWDNIEHIIIARDLSKDKASALEKELIIKYKSNSPEYGFNKTNGGEIVEVQRKKEHYVIGENIKQLREKDGYSQGELAKLVDIPQSLLWKYEHNVAVPSVLNATKLAKFFHITVEQLIKKED